MKRVVLFKNESDEYEKVFMNKNYQVKFVEPLQFKFIHQEELGQKLLIKDYDGLILTSPRSIEACAKCWDPTKFVIWNSKQIYTVGETSRDSIKLMLGLDAIGYTSGNAENLAKTICSESSRPLKFFFPCGNMTSEILPNLLVSKDITVDSLTVYETQENSNLQSQLIALDNDINPCCMVFFSPSGCEYIHRQLQTFSNNLKLLPHFAIGNSTAHKIENLGLEVAGVAARPKADSLLESVENYFGG